MRSKAEEEGGELLKAPVLQLMEVDVDLGRQEAPHEEPGDGKPRILREGGGGNPPEEGEEAEQSFPGSFEAASDKVTSGRDDDEKKIDPRGPGSKRKQSDMDYLDAEKFKEQPTVQEERTGTYDLSLGFTPGTFGAFATGAATPGENKPSPSGHPGKKSDCGFTRDGGFGEVARWLGSRIDVLLDRRCKTKPTGRLFPLPTSIAVLQAVLSSSFTGCWVMLRSLVASLNSLNGEGSFSGTKPNDFQVAVLKFLSEQVERTKDWECKQEPATWESFFKVRTVDYLGEEVKTAQPIEWRNVAPALPDEVGGIALREVVERGCRHYVDNFRDYLIPEEDQLFVKPPKVMVPSDSWDELCQGLISKGVCGLIAEENYDILSSLRQRHLKLT